MKLNGVAFSVIAFLGVSSLSKCSPLVSSLLATIMSNWEVYRGTSVDQSSLHFKVTCFITDVMTKVCLVWIFFSSVHLFHSGKY